MPSPLPLPLSPPYLGLGLADELVHYGTQERVHVPSKEAAGVDIAHRGGLRQGGAEDSCEAGVELHVVIAGVMSVGVDV